MNDPMKKAQITGVMPMNKDKRVPTIKRVSMSRPSSSVPKGCPAKPMGLSRLSMDDWYGSRGANHGPKTASTSNTTTTKAAATATLSCRKRRPTVCQ